MISFLYLTLRSTRLRFVGSPLVTVYPDLSFIILDQIHLASLILMMSILYVQKLPRDIPPGKLPLQRQGKIRSRIVVIV